MSQILTNGHSMDDSHGQVIVQGYKPWISSLTIVFRAHKPCTMPQTETQALKKESLTYKRKYGHDLDD
jgi:hypothetical protein